MLHKCIGRTVAIKLTRAEYAGIINRGRVIKTSFLPAPGQLTRLSVGDLTVANTFAERQYNVC